MKLFSKDLDLIKRVLNLILVVWFLGAIIFTYTNTVELIMDNDKYTNKTYQVKALVNSIGNTVIVGSFMFFLNREKNKM